MAYRIVIEATRTTIRVALAEGGGARFRLRAIRSQPIGQSGDASEALQSLLKTTKALGAQVIAVVPREQVITRVVKFPSVNPAEIAQMAEVYAKGQLPYPREQTVMDVHVLGQADGFSTVAVIACQREVVDRQLALLRDAGVSAGLLTLSSWGVLGWYGEMARTAPAVEPALVIHVDDSRTDLVLIAGGRILSSRSIGQGTLDWTISSETPELLGREAERSRASIRKELPGTEVRSVILTGLGPLAEWKDAIAQRLGLPVSTLEASRPFKNAMTQMAVPISPVVVGGLAIADARSLLNLSPPEVRGRANQRKQLQELGLLGGLLLGVCVLGAGLLGAQVARQRQVSAQIGEALAGTEPTAKQIKEKTRVSQVVSGVLEDRRQLAQVLSGIFRSTTGGATLDVVTFDRARREVGVRGNAPSTQDVLNYIKQLEQLDGIETVELKYSTRRSTPAGERTDFELLLHQGHRAS